MYYCPKCDKALPKDRVERADRELKERYGLTKLSELRCPVCDSEFIDLDKVAKGGERHVGESRRPRSVR